MGTQSKWDSARSVAISDSDAQRLVAILRGKPVDASAFAVEAAILVGDDCIRAGPDDYALAVKHTPVGPVDCDEFGFVTELPPTVALYFVECRRP